MKLQDKNKKSTALVEAEVTHLTPSERILAPLESEYWDADTWHQIIDDLAKLTDWVKALQGPF